MGQLTSFRFKPGGADGSLRQSRGTFKGASSYATGGDVIYARDVGLVEIAALFAVGCNSSGVATHLAYFHSGVNRGSQNQNSGIHKGKLLITQLSDGQEVADATDLSGVTFTGCVAHGR
jgi:hypothetical protein